MASKFYAQSACRRSAWRHGRCQDFYLIIFSSWMKTSKGIPGDISGVIFVEITDYILEEVLNKIGRINAWIPEELRTFLAKFLLNVWRKLWRNYWSYSLEFLKVILNENLGGSVTLGESLRKLEMFLEKYLIGFIEITRFVFFKLKIYSHSDFWPMPPLFLRPWLEPLVALLVRSPVWKLP